ncbi:MAG TPA: metallophosphoesterase [Polyangiales bacterium]|nr:metallophosphoesterase [Polyangiales bacterium]
MQNDRLPKYTSVHVVSDLHLGGYASATRNFRIFRETDALAWFIRSLARNEQGRVALVLNGDIVDYLADPAAVYFDWENAVAKLQRAVTDPEQRAVWEALRDFVESGHGDLVLVLGNHDLELALPDPQQYLLHFLSDGQHARRSRVIFATDGAGFSCRVGDERVLCVHGNEVDPWNAIDYGRLSLIRRALARGSKERNHDVLHGWIPNAGTQMVIDHLNHEKRKYQWLDLLKPEDEATAMIAAAWKSLPGLKTFAAVMREKGRTAKLLAQGFLSGGDAQHEERDPMLPIAPDFAAPARAADALIRDALERLGQDAVPAHIAEQEEQQEFLLSFAELQQVARGAKLRFWPNNLRDTLRETLADDKTFEPDTVDDTFRELDVLCAPEIDFLIAGHTHLHRALQRTRCSGYYFNSGSWIRLLQVPLAALEDAAFEELRSRLDNGSLEALEQPIATSRGPVSLLRPTRTVVTIEQDERGVSGMLQTVEPDHGSWQLRPVDRTRFTRQRAKA